MSEATLMIFIVRDNLCGTVSATSLWREMRVLRIAHLIETETNFRTIGFRKVKSDDLIAYLYHGYNLPRGSLNHRTPSEKGQNSGF